MSRKRFTEKQWKSWFEEFEHAGMTVEKFCKVKGTTANTFYKWKKKFKAKAESNRQTISDSDTPFVPLVVETPAVQAFQLNESHVEFHLPGGVVAKIPNDRQSLKPMLQSLLELRAEQ